MRNVSDKFVEKIKTHIFHSVTFFSENRAVCEIMWEKIVERGRTQKAIWRMRIACWMTKSTHTHAHTHTRKNTHTHNMQYLLQKLLPERALMLRFYVNCLSYSQIFHLFSLHFIIFHHSSSVSRNIYWERKFRIYKRNVAQ